MHHSSRTNAADFIAHRPRLAPCRLQQKLDVADEPLVPAASKTTATASARTSTSGGSPQLARATPFPITAAGDFTATTGGANSAAGVMLGDGAGGGGDDDGGSGSGSSRLRAMEGTEARGESVSGVPAAGYVGSGGSSFAQDASSQSTPEGWEGAAHNDWDQDGGDHCNAVAVASAAAAAATPTAAGGDSLSETSSSGGGGDAPLTPSRRVIPSVSSNRFSTAGAAAGVTAVPGVSPRLSTIAPGVKGVSPRFTSSAGRVMAGAKAAEALAEVPSAMPSAAPQERPASPDFRRFLTPHELESFGTPSSAASSRVPPFEVHVASGSGVGREEEEPPPASGARGGRDRSLQEQRCASGL